MIGSDGRLYHFNVQPNLRHIIRGDERSTQFYTLLNNLLEHYNETRRRHLRYTVPISVPLNNRLRLLETSDCIVSMESILNSHLQSHGTEPIDIIVKYRRAMMAVPALSPRSENGTSTNREHDAKVLTQRVAIWKQACTADGMHDRILDDYIRRTILGTHTGKRPSNDKLWAFKHNFAMQLALQNFITYILCVGNRNPALLSIDNSTAAVHLHQFYPRYREADHLIDDEAEAVPFRMTPNLKRVLSPFLLHGVYGATKIATAACLLKHQDIVKNYLYLYIRDDLLSWQQATSNPSNPIVFTDQQTCLFDSKMRECVSQNTLCVLKRINSLMHHSSKTQQAPIPINRNGEDLIKRAIDPANLAQMPAFWQPFF